MNLILRSFTDTDLALYTRWLAQAHVRRWFAPTEDWLAEINARKDTFAFIRHFMILLDGTPIGFCQYYPYELGGEDWHGSVPLQGTYSIDYLIGETACLRKGYGAEAIRLLVEDIFSIPQAERIIVQPEAENEASRRALQRAGFVFDPANQLFILTRPKTAARSRSVETV